MEDYNPTLPIAKCQKDHIQEMRNYPTLAIGISIVILRGIINIDFYNPVEKLFRPTGLWCTDFVVYL